MKASKVFRVLGSEDMKQGEEHRMRMADVLDEDNDRKSVAVEASSEVSPPEANGRPPKPSEDAIECPGWEEGRKRSRPWLRCQGWAIPPCSNCKHCAQFERNAPINQSVPVQALSKVLNSARVFLEGQNGKGGVILGFRQVKVYKDARQELTSIADQAQKAHSAGERNFKKFSRQVEELIPEIFLGEAQWLLSQCESHITRKSGNNGNLLADVRDAFHEWEREVNAEKERAAINGEYPRWIFAGRLRWLHRRNVEETVLNNTVASLHNGPNTGRNTFRRGQERRW